MSYRFFLFTLFLCLCALGITAYRPVATPAVALAPTPLPPTPLPPTPLPQTPLAPVTPGPAFQSDAGEHTAILALAPFTITFPAAWSVLRPERNTWIQAVKHLQQTKPELAGDLDTISAMAAGETTLALAWQPATTTTLSTKINTKINTEISLVAAVTPAEDLTLSTYLTALTDELSKSELATKPPITLQSVSIRYDLHQEGIPVAVLHYVTTEEPGAAVPLTTHYHAVLLDETATHLLMLTFTVRDPQPAAALTVIDAIIATIQQN